MKSKLIRFMSIVSILLVLVFSGWVFYKFGVAFKKHNEAVRLPPPGSIAEKQSSAIWAQVREEEGVLAKALALEKEGKYDLAIEEYKKALNIVRGDFGEIRYGLSICYEKTGQYALALKEIDWLLDRKVLATPELLERKKRIQELIQK